MTQISKLNFNIIDAFFSKASDLNLCHFEWQNKRHSFYILREDLLHPALSGNKFRKLYGWLKHYKSGNFESIESMGGAHSNHLSALVYACLSLNIPCKVFVPIGSKSILLDKIRESKIIVEEVSRYDFRLLREKEESNKTGTLWIPEGGKGERSLEGFRSVAEQLAERNLEGLVSAGTGCTALAMASFGLPVLALLAVKDQSVLSKLEQENITVFQSYGLAKFGKLKDDALSLACTFFEQTGVLLDPVYQAKAMLLLCQKNALSTNTAFIHTGGLQGWMGYAKELEANFPESIKNEVYANFDAIFTA